jgi:hypothetical protein
MVASASVSSQSPLPLGWSRLYQMLHLQSEIMEQSYDHYFWRFLQIFLRQKMEF